MENNNNNNINEQKQEKQKGSRFPSGFRFVPTDEELIVDYLAVRVRNQPIPVAEINDVFLYKSTPEVLAESYPQLGDKKWYFFTPRDRKYPNGSRPSRSVKDKGYWKATGADQPIFSANGRIIGRKKTLVFYVGNPKPSGTSMKTSWIMHEYMLNTPPRSPTPENKKLDDWVLCRIYKKPISRSNKKEKQGNGGDLVPVDEDNNLEAPFFDGYDISSEDFEALDLHENNNILNMDQMIIHQMNNVVSGDAQGCHHHQQFPDNNHDMNFSYRGFNQGEANPMVHAGPSQGSVSLYGQNGNFQNGMFYDSEFHDTLEAILGQDQMGLLWSNECGTANYIPEDYSSDVLGDINSVDDCMKGDEGQTPNHGGNQNHRDEQLETKKGKGLDG